MLQSGWTEWNQEWNFFNTFSYYSTCIKRYICQMHVQSMISDEFQCEYLQGGMSDTDLQLSAVCMGSMHTAISQRSIQIYDIVVPQFYSQSQHEQICKLFPNSHFSEDPSDRTRYLQLSLKKVCFYYSTNNSAKKLNLEQLVSKLFYWL